MYDIQKTLHRRILDAHNGRSLKPSSCLASLHGLSMPVLPQWNIGGNGTVRGRFFYRIIDGEFIPGPLIRGIIVTLQLAGVSSVITAFVINAFIMRPCFDP